MGTNISEDLAASVLKLVQEDWAARGKATIILRKGMRGYCKGQRQLWSTFAVDGAVSDMLEW